MEIKEILSNPWVWVIGGGVVLLSVLTRSSSTIDTTGLTVASTSSANAQNAAIQNNQILSNASIENNKSQSAVYIAQIQNDATVKTASLSTISDMVSNILSSGNNNAAINASMQSTANTNTMEISRSYADLSAKIKTANTNAIINGQNVNGAVDLANIDSKTKIELGFQQTTAAYRVQDLISNEHIQVNADNNNAIVASYPYQLKSITAQVNGQTALQTILSNAQTTIENIRAGVSNNYINKTGDWLKIQSDTAVSLGAQQANTATTLGGMRMASNILTSQANERAIETQSGDNKDAAITKSVLSAVTAIVSAYMGGGAAA